MKISVLYFSRSGVTKDVAEEVANQLEIKAIQVSDQMNWSGIWGYIKGGYYASAMKPVEITYDKSCLDSDLFIIMSPLWAGGPAPSIRTLFNEIDNKKVYLLLTNDGSDVNKAFAKTNELYPYIHKMYGITKKLKNKEQVIAQIISDVKNI